MNETHSTTSIEHPNAETIAGLREVADWLEQHPELPVPWWACLNFRNSYSGTETAREELTAFAGALDGRATEDYDGSTVTIAARFSGGIDVKCVASVRDLGAEPSRPAYEPIIAVVPEPDEPVPGILTLPAEARA